MSWPTPQEYNEAIQNPHLNFADEELKCGLVELNQLGLPHPSTGAFASVYRMKCEDRDVAVRCFLQSISDQPTRYKVLSDKLHAIRSDLFVGFEYVNHGILVRNAWHPIVKMEWAHGKTLDSYIQAHHQNPETIEKLLRTFEEAYNQLQVAGIAHGDLQHGNVIIDDAGKLRLIDYDGSFVPDISSLGSNELGHPNYQHPGRSKSLFAPSMDNFSAWVIQQSLQAVALDSELIRRLHGCEECIILRHIDYAQPSRSAAFHILEASELEGVRECGRRLRSLCALSPDAIPPLGNLHSLPVPIALSNKPDNSRLMTLADPDDKLGDDDSAIAAAFAHLPVETGPWPTVREYTQAIRLPVLRFEDPELQTAKPFKRNNSIWRQLGKESVVFPLQTKNGRVAIKCFLGEDPTRAERYLQIESYFKRHLPWAVSHHMVPFEYISNGIKIENQWYPIVKMPWLQGAIPLDEYMMTAQKNKYVTMALADAWRDLLQKLQKAGISHGNLEPNNIVMHDGRLKLLDFDTMFVPTMRGKQYEPVAFNNPDFVHPSAQKQISEHSDRFTAWIIDTAITAYALDPALYQILDNRRGRMLFNAADFADPANSRLFALLYHNFHSELSARAVLLYRFLFTPPDRIPPLRAKAVPLLPAETGRQLRIRNQQVEEQTALIIVCLVGIAMLSALPHGSIFGLIPTAALALTVRDMLREQRKHQSRRS